MPLTVSVITRKSVKSRGRPIATTDVSAAEYPRTWRSVLLSSATSPCPASALPTINGQSLWSTSPGSSAEKAVLALCHSRMSTPGCIRIFFSFVHTDFLFFFFLTTSGRQWVKPVRYACELACILVLTIKGASGIVATYDPRTCPRPEEIKSQTQIFTLPTQICF